MDLTVDQYAAFEQIINLFLRQEQSIKIDKSGSSFDFFICDLILRYVDVCILTIAYDPEVTNEVDDVICIYLALEAFQLQHPKEEQALRFFHPCHY